MMTYCYASGEREGRLASRDMLLVDELRVKEYHFFDLKVPLSTLGSVNKLFSVACLPTNFQGPVILTDSDKQNE
ncbi:hypothetical protein pdam_00020706 [Pocillopora damicornis]|uniref:Uncharacterized protein n=1 Tax=Pocillopora damicornis TaxID=46731 RepID=A0A3M6TH26_POCDA|nr:hypothetical protein pdam_00020706 [Pocillopora damicornis]